MHARFLAPVLVAALGALAAPAAGHAQIQLAVEAGASRAGAPSDVDQAAGNFVLGGLRAESFGRTGSGGSASFLIGRSLDSETGGDFLSGTLAGSLLHELGRGWSGGIEGRAQAFRVESPFPYRATGVEGGPVLRYRGGSAWLRVEGLGGVGRSELELRRRTDGPVRLVEEELWRYGATAEFLVGSGAFLAGAAAGIHRSAGGDYSSLGGRMLIGGVGIVSEIRVDVWETPLGRETTGGISIVVPVRSGWGVRGFFGRSEPDPLTLAEPGSGGFGLLAGRSLYYSAGTGDGTSLYRTIEEAPGGALVEVRVSPPGSPRAVVLVGDFTLWEERPMEREGEEWILRLEVPAGTHHFGFLVDGDWYLPADAPDRVPDEWGRESATLVIER